MEDDLEEKKWKKTSKKMKLKKMKDDLKKEMEDDHK
jgi:hypothetical protein